jgi:hypothetical protein
MINNEAQTQFNSLLQQAERHVQERDFRSAQQILTRAHGSGHAIKSDHLKAHRALIRVAFLRRDPLQVLSQSALLILAFVFD